MTWAAQVGHVVVKDVRQARWLLLAYLIIVALAMARALDWPGTSNTVFETAMYAVVLTGMFLTAYYVQADSPSRSDAFWASRPFQPTAMLVAKLLVATVAVAAPALVAQVMALRDNGVAVAATPPLVMQSTWMYGGWLLIAAVLAAVTSDLRGFTTALVASFIAFVLASTLVDGFWQWTSALVERVTPIASGAFGVAAALAVLYALYTTRTMRRRVWAGVGLSVAGSAVAIFAPWTPLAPGQPAMAMPAGVSFRVTLRGSDPQASLAVTVDGVRPSRYAMTLGAPAIVLRLADGTPLRLPFNNDRLDLTWAPLPLGRDIRVIGYSDAPYGYTKTISLTPSERDALRRGIVKATMEGSLAAREPRAVVTVPLRTGAVGRREGTRVDIITAFRHGEDSFAEVRRTGISGSSDGIAFAAGTDPSLNAPHYVLVNPARHEAVTLTEGMTRSSSDGVVVPGAWRYMVQSTLRPAAQAGDPTKDDTWLSQARLAVIDWVPRNESWVHVDATVVP
jgi:ABC-type transport system involved in multi-copper enzyme maturation permease subunit